MTASRTYWDGNCAHCCSRSSAPISGFTLIELLVVTALIAVAVGMVTVRLDGISRSGRLCSAARQVGMFYRTARVQAMTEGRPRILEYACEEGGPQQLSVRQPIVSRDGIKWVGGHGFVLTGGVRVLNVVQDGESDTKESGSREPHRIWISPDGIAVSHVVVLGSCTQPEAATLIDGVTGEDRFMLIADGGKFDPRPLLEQTHALSRSDTD